LILQTGKALVAKSSPPLANDLRAHLQPARDLHVGQTLGRVEHDLRTLHVAIRKRQLGSAPLELDALLLNECDLDRRRHHQRDSPPAL
jgi:hypothetical protein